MFRASSCPSSGATTTALAAPDLPLELGDSSAVGHGRAGCGGSECVSREVSLLTCSDPPQLAQPRPTALLSPRSDGKPEAAAAVVVAPNDGHEDA